MSDVCLRLVAEHFPDLPRPSRTRYPQYALLELSSHESEAARAWRCWKRRSSAALEAGVAQDAVVATSIAQSRALWAIREHIPLAQAAAGKNIKHDISLPISRIADFIETTDALLAARLSRRAGGLLRPPGRRQPALQRRAAGRHRATTPSSPSRTRSTASCTTAWPRFGGSISAEHGIGALKRDELPRYKSPVELDLMRAIKAALDPLGIMNPGKIL